MTRIWIFLLGFLSGAVSAIADSPVPAMADTWGPVDGRVIAFQTGEPIKGAIVIAQWIHDVGWGSQVCVHAESVVSDAEGRYHFSAWYFPRSGFGEYLGDMFWNHHWIDLVEYKEGYTWVHRRQQVDPKELNRLVPFHASTLDRLDELKYLIHSFSDCLESHGEGKKDWLRLREAVFDEALAIAHTPREQEMLDSVSMMNKPPAGIRYGYAGAVPTPTVQLTDIRDMAPKNEPIAGSIKAEIGKTPSQTDFGHIGSAKRVFMDCDSCPVVVEISAGSFDMGADDVIEGDDPHRGVTVSQHRVSITHAFALARTEVTRGQWKEMMGVLPNVSCPSCNENYPVDNVQWSEAQEYTRRLSRRTGKLYRLPSEAEWEYACRAGSHQEYCGSDEIDEVAWYFRNSNPLHKPSGPHVQLVGQKRPNAWGLYDMSGNTWEWVEDCYHASYDGAPTDGSAWVSSDCKQRVMRGGAAWNNEASARAASRFGTTPEGLGVGLRVVRILP